MPRTRSRAHITHHTLSLSHTHTGTSTLDFKYLPCSFLSATLAEMYPFVRTERTKWDTISKKVQHPMHALWPYPTVNRYLNFFTLFRAKRTQLFALYEQQDGEYHGPDTIITQPSAAVVSTSVETSAGDDSDPDFADADFV